MKNLSISTLRITAQTAEANPSYLSSLPQEKLGQLLEDLDHALSSTQHGAAMDIEAIRLQVDTAEFRRLFLRLRESVSIAYSEKMANFDAPPVSNDNKEFTTARQVLAIHYLLEYCQVRGIDQTKKAHFIQFLTGKNQKNIYDLVCNPLSTKSKDFRQRDLQFIRTYFEDLGLTEIVKMINNELEKAGL